MTHLLYFSIGWLVIIYAFNCIFVQKVKKIEATELILYLSTVLLIGVGGEIFVGNLYYRVFEVPLWEYRVLPLHHAYTSFYSVFIWSMYGFHLYLFHDSLKKWGISSGRKLASIIAIEAVILEILFNISHLFIFDEYVFYYLPNDVWHLTSFQAIPFYFLAGIAIAKTVKLSRTKPLFFVVLNYAMVVMLFFLIS